MEFGSKEHTRRLRAMRAGGGRNDASPRYDIVYATMLNVSGDIETVASADRMGWTGTYIEGYFIRGYDPFTGETTQWIGDTDEGEPIGFDTKQQAERYLERLTL